MVGLGIKKFAKEQGLTVEKGWAYGTYRGYGLLLSEGLGYKMAMINLYVDPKTYEESVGPEIDRIIGEEDLAKKYRIIECTAGHDGIIVSFEDNPGTMKIMIECIDWMISVIKAQGACGASFCQYCGKPIAENEWHRDLEGGAVPFHVHEACLEQMWNEPDDEEDELELEELAPLNRKMRERVEEDKHWLVKALLGIGFLAIIVLANRFL